MNPLRLILSLWIFGFAACGGSGGLDAADTNPELPVQGDGILPDEGRDDGSGDVAPDTPAEDTVGAPYAVPSVRLTLDSDRSGSDGVVTASWEAGGSLEGLELRVTVRRPGPVTFDGTSSLGGASGTAPATGKLQYLHPDGTWGDDETPYATPAVGGQAQLPALDRDGEWQVGVFLREVATARNVAVGSRTLWVASRPALRLSMNRLAGTGLDEFRATLDVAAGGSSQEIRLFAWIRWTDWTHAWSLPGPVQDHLAYAYEGPAKDLTIPLLGQRLPAVREDEGSFGYYEVGVRMLDAQGRVIGLAEQWFGVCDGTVPVRGAVLGNDGAPLGPGATSTRVTFWDLTRGGAALQTSLDSQGTYQAELAPGHYIALVEVVDGRGIHRGLSRTLAVENCVSTFPATLDLRTTPPEPCEGTCASARVARLDAPFPLPQPTASAPPTPWISQVDRLPKPQVYLGYSGTGGFPPSELNDVQRELKKALEPLEPEVVFTGRSDILAIMGRMSDLMLSGYDETSNQDQWVLDHAQQLIDRFASFDFEITVLGENVIRKELHGELVDLGHRATTLATDRYLVGSVDTAMDEAKTAAAVQHLASRLRADGSLFDRIRTLQDRPVSPVMEIAIAPAVAMVGSTVSVTVTMTDLDGAVQVGKSLEVWNTNGNGTREAPRACVTDAQGRCQVTFTATSSFLWGPASEGKVTAVYTRLTGQRFEVDPPKPYSILQVTDLQVIPDAVTVKPNESTTVTVTYRQGGSPTANAAIDLAATLGTVDPATVTTDASGRATSTFTAGAQNGQATVSATPTSGGTSHGEARIHVDGEVEVTLQAVPASVGDIPQTSMIQGRVVMAGSPLPDVPVHLTTTAGGFDVPAVSTDASGNFQATWLSPVAGTGAGTAILRAVVWLDQYDYDSTVQIDFDDPAWVDPSGPFDFYNGSYAGTVDWLQPKVCGLPCSATECLVTMSGLASMEYYATGSSLQGVAGTATVGFTWGSGSTDTYVFDLTTWCEVGRSLVQAKCLSTRFLKQDDGSVIVTGEVYDYWNTCHRYPFEMTRPAVPPL